MEVNTVQEVVQATRLIKSADKPRKIRRAINLHGSVVPAIDMNTYLGEESSEIDENTLIFFIAMGQSAIGITVGGIGKVLSITPTSIVPSDNLDSTSSFVTGTLRIDNRTIILLDIIQGLMM